VDDGTGSDLWWGGKRKGGKEFVDLLGAQEPGGLIVFAKHAGSYEQRSQVFLHHPALPIQVPEESPQTISIDAACRASNLKFCQEAIEVLDLHTGKGNVVFFKVGVETTQNPSCVSEVIGRNLVGLLVEIGVKGIGQLNGFPWFSQRLGEFALAIKKAWQLGENAGCVFETAKLGELLQGVEGEHVFPNHLVGRCEAKEVNQEKGIPGDGAMDSIGL
jgi:hypothetical protein